MTRSPDSSRAVDRARPPARITDSLRVAVTISLVEEARGGPFVFWDDFAAGCAEAARLGFHAVELFPPAADAVAPAEIRRALSEHGLALAAVGTGAGWVRQRLTLTAADRRQRQQAIDYVRSIVDLAAEFQSAAIIGSMQGRTSAAVDRDTAIGYLADALDVLAAHAGQSGARLLIEPLNRYESDLLNTLDQGLALLDALASTHVCLLADLFHMNIEEVDLAAALRRGGQRIGHIHWVDSNRRAPGLGHLDFAPLAAALGDIDYRGYLSAEALPLPDSTRAASAMINHYLTHFGHNN